MAVPEQTPIKAHTGNGVTTVFAYDFLVLEAADMLVLVDGVEVSSALYSVAGTGVDTGGTVTFATAPASSAEVVLLRDSVVTRETDYQSNGDLLASVINRDFDRLWLVLQEVIEGAKSSTRTVRGPVGEVLGELPAAALRADMLLSFDTSGNPIAVAPVAGTATALSADLASTAAGKGDALVGVKLDATGSVARTQHDKNEDMLCVFDFMTAAQITDVRAYAFGVNVDAAVQAALDESAGRTIYFPKGGYLVNNLTQKTRCKIVGDGPRASRIRQASGATGVLLSWQTGKPPTGAVNDISEGAFALERIGLEVKGSTGIKAEAGLFGMVSLRDVRILHQNAESLGSAPYSVVAGTRGIDLNGGAGSTANIYVADCVNLEIRNFETGIYARNTVNEWRVHGWLLDCKVGLDADNISTWWWNASIESGVADARGFKFTTAVGNFLALGGRVELTQATSYLVEFSGAVSASNVRFREININILGDGGAWPGRKYTGTLPKDVLFEFSNTATNESRVAGASTAETAYTHPLRLGGATLGNGKLTFGRDAGGADGVIEHDGTYLLLSAANGVRFKDAGGASGYLNPVWLGGFALWVDSAGKLRITPGFPASDTDGTVVGTQT